jgi:hypothetical protein
VWNFRFVAKAPPFVSHYFLRHIATSTPPKPSLKAWLFLFIGFLSAGILLVENWSWHTAGLLALGVWGFCRAYFFAFYVIGGWVDPQFMFSGLGHFILWWWRRRGGA